MRVAAVIPVLNEEGAIGSVLSRLSREVVEFAIVVDGGSKDGTVAEARGLGAVVVEEARRGYGRACLSGAERARSLGCDVALFMDGDGADAVELSARLIEPLAAGTADFVIATRAGGKREAGSMGAHQLLAGYLIGGAVGLLSGVRYSDMCAFRAIRLDDLDRLDMQEMQYGWNLEMQIKAARAGLRVLEVALPYYRRVAGESKVAGSFRGTARAGFRIVEVLVRVGLGGARLRPNRGA